MKLRYLVFASAILHTQCTLPVLPAVWPSSLIGPHWGEFCLFCWIFFLKNYIFFWFLFFVLFSNIFCFGWSWSTMQSKGKIMSNSVRNLPYPLTLIGMKNLLYPSLPVYSRFATLRKQTMSAGNIKTCNENCRRSLFRFSSDFSRF